MKIVNCLWTNLVILCLILPAFKLSEIGIGGLKKNLMHYKKLRGEANAAPAQPEPGKAPASTSATVDEKSKLQELPDIPVYYQGWVKYLHYFEKENNKPKAFYKNNEFAYQSKKGLSAQDLAKKDNVN
jgi:hypothetical protein